MQTRQQVRDGSKRKPLPPSAAQSIARTVRAGTETYDRRRHLRRLLPVGPAEVADTSAAGRRHIVRLLARALRAERNRGRAGHWTYDLNRHIALAQAYVAERQGMRRGG